MCRCDDRPNPQDPRESVRCRPQTADDIEPVPSDLAHAGHAADRPDDNIFHVGGRYYANLDDAERERKAAAARRVREAARRAAYEARQEARTGEQHAPPSGALARDGRPRVGTWLTSRERSRVDTAAGAVLELVHRETLPALHADLARGIVDATLLSAAMVRPSDAATVAAIVRDFPGSLAVAFLADADEPRALDAALAFGRAGIDRLIDARLPSGWSALRHAFASDRLPDVFVRHALRVLLGNAAQESAQSSEREGKVENGSTEGSTNGRTSDRSSGNAGNGNGAGALAPTAAREYTEGWTRFLAGAFHPSVATARDLAVMLGVLPTTLTSRFFRAGLPSPKRYVAFARLVWAARLAEAPGMSIAAIALRLDASSPQAFGRTVKQMTGLTAGDFRQHFTGEAMLERYRAALVEPYRATLRSFDPLRASGVPGTAGAATGGQRARRSDTRSTAHGNRRRNRREAGRAA